VEQRQVLGPRDNRTRRHHRRQVAVGEATARQHDVHLLVLRQVVQRDRDVPAVHLSLVERLRAVVEPRGIAQSDGVRRGKQAGCRMRLDDTALVEQREPPFHFEHALDDKHHVGAADIVLVEHQRARAAS